MAQTAKKTAIKKATGVSLKRGKLVRDAIAKAALKRFVRDGVAGVRMLDIAKDAGVSHPLLRYHFPTLENLTEAVFAQVLESLKLRSVEHIDRNRGSRERLLDYVGAPFDWAMENRKLYSLWIYFFYQASLSSEARRQNTEIRAVGRKRMESLIHHGIAEGKFKLPAKDVASVALEIQTLITGGFVMAFTEDGLDPEDMRARTQRAVLGAVRGE